MAVGQQPTADQINATLTSLALQWEKLASATIREWRYLNKLGSSGLQAAPIGLSSSDAAAALDMINHMVTPAQVYRGTVQGQGTGGTGAILFDFGDYLTLLWAGQVDP